MVCDQYIPQSYEQQQMLEIEKTIYKWEHFSICCTILTLSVIKLVTIEGHRFLNTINSCKHHTTSSNQGSISVDL